MSATRANRARGTRRITTSATSNEEPQGEAAQAQQVTTKDPKKVEAGKRLAAINRKK